MTADYCHLPHFPLECTPYILRVCVKQRGTVNLCTKCTNVRWNFGLIFSFTPHSSTRWMAVLICTSLCPIFSALLNNFSATCGLYFDESRRQTLQQPQVGRSPGENQQLLNPALENLCVSRTSFTQRGGVPVVSIEPYESRTGSTRSQLHHGTRGFMNEKIPAQLHKNSPHGRTIRPKRGMETPSAPKIIGPQCSHTWIFSLPRRYGHSRLDINSWRSPKSKRTSRRNS